jgi:hypothetical protein
LKFKNLKGGWRWDHTVNCTGKHWQLCSDAGALTVVLRR